MTSVARTASNGLVSVTPDPGETISEDHYKQGATSPIKTGVTLAVLIIPVLALFATAALWFANWVDIGVFVGLYFYTGCIGITIGYHRYFTHRSFKTGRVMRAVFAISGQMALQGPVMEWVANHRRHHNFSDEPGDPHSPHVGREAGAWGAVKGWWHAHVGWLVTERQSRYGRYVPDLLKDPMIDAIDKAFPLVALLSLLIPFGLGWALKGSVVGGLMTMLFAGFVRIFFVDHATWFVNSICHMIGAQPFAIDDESRNNWWLAPFTFGEAWHQNHHTAPTSAAHAFTFREKLADPSWWVIWYLEKVGLVWDVVRIPPEKLEAQRKPAAVQTVQTAA